MSYACATALHFAGLFCWISLSSCASPPKPAAAPRRAAPRTSPAVCSCRGRLTPSPCGPCGGAAHALDYSPHGPSRALRSAVRAGPGGRVEAAAAIEPSRREYSGSAARVACRIRIVCCVVWRVRRAACSHSAAHHMQPCHARVTTCVRAATSSKSSSRHPSESLPITWVEYPPISPISPICPGRP